MRKLEKKEIEIEQCFIILESLKLGISFLEDYLKQEQGKKIN